MGPNLYISPGTIHIWFRIHSSLFSPESSTFPLLLFPHLWIIPITIGGGYTQFHQDGHGTVDSGHSCLNGYNEVVMLRRLPECHKRQACQSIPSTSTKDNNRTGPLGSVATASLNNSDKVSCQNQAENVLYRLPHDDNRNDKLTWAQTSTIEEWEKLG